MATRIMEYSREKLQAVRVEERILLAERGEIFGRGIFFSLEGKIGGGQQQIFFGVLGRFSGERKFEREN